MGLAVTERDWSDSEDGTLRRFDVELLIVHPAIDPADITVALGLEPVNARRAGDRRETPTGAPLPGNYPDTRWRHCVRYGVRNQLFADEFDTLVRRLEPHKAFLGHLRATGGRTCLIIQFLGDGCHGDTISADTLTTLVDMGLSLGIECFVDPQSP
jgi:hypothetical protein